jgi:hypothetical protein
MSHVRSAVRVSGTRTYKTVHTMYKRQLLGEIARFVGKVDFFLTDEHTHRP